MAATVREWINNKLKHIAVRYTSSVLNLSGRNDWDKNGDFYINYFKNAREYKISNYCYNSHRTDYVIDLTKAVHNELLFKFDVVFVYSVIESVLDVNIGFRHMCQLSNKTVIIVTALIMEETNANIKNYWRLTGECINDLFARENMVVVEKHTSPFINERQMILTVAEKL